MDGSIRVVNAATLVCLRRSMASDTLNTASPGHLPPSSLKSGSWDVLLGQSEVKNWLRSTPLSTRIMRYPGEWKFPGGVVDEGDASLEDTALRELEEEFLGVTVPRSSAQVHFLVDRITRPIQNRRHRMFNFVALAEENHKWLNESTIQLVNECLAMKREEFATHVASGRYWNMTEQEKMIVSPEIRRIEWFPIDQAIAMMESSLLDPYTPIDEWQRSQFHEYGVERRDPMFVTMKILQHIAAFESPEALLTHTKQLTAPLLESLHQSSNL